MLEFSVGLDCAGEQKEYQQISQLNIDTTHLKNGSYVIARIHVDEPAQDTAAVLPGIMVLWTIIS